MPGEEPYARSVLSAATERWPELSPDVQAQLEPYLSPPSYATPTAELKLQQQTPRGTGCLRTGTPPELDAAWEAVATAHATIWFPSAGDDFYGADARDPAQLRQAATWVAQAVEQVYAAETELFGVHPLPDTAQRCNGGNGAVDIYLKRRSISTSAFTTAYAPGCEVRPSWITIAPDILTSATFTRDVVAHEFAHVLQFAGYDLAEECSDYDWLGEATANWAIDHVTCHDTTATALGVTRRAVVTHSPTFHAARPAASTRPWPKPAASSTSWPPAWPAATPATRAPRSKPRSPRSAGPAGSTASSPPP